LKSTDLARRAPAGLTASRHALGNFIQRLSRKFPIWRVTRRTRDVTGVRGMSREGEFEGGDVSGRRRFTVRGEARWRICSTVAMVRSTRRHHEDKPRLATIEQPAEEERCHRGAQVEARVNEAMDLAGSARAPCRPATRVARRNDRLSKKRKERGQREPEKVADEAGPFKLPETKASCRGLWPRGTIAAPAHVLRRPIRRF
jgi:hypothetical protein